MCVLVALYFLRTLSRCRTLNKTCHALCCLNFTKFGQLILRKVLKIVATICLDFSSKWTKMRLAAGLRLDPLGELKRSPRPPSRNKGGLLLRGGEGKGGEGRRGGREGEGKGSGREGEGGERERGKGLSPREKNFWRRHCFPWPLLEPPLPQTPHLDLRRPTSNSMDGRGRKGNGLAPFLKS